MCFTSRTTVRHLLDAWGYRIFRAPFIARYNCLDNECQGAFAFFLPDTGSNRLGTLLILEPTGRFPGRKAGRRRITVIQTLTFELVQIRRARGACGAMPPMHRAGPPHPCPKMKHRKQGHRVAVGQLVVSGRILWADMKK
jgi:hypothetical protein